MAVVTQDDVLPKIFSPAASARLLEECRARWPGCAVWIPQSIAPSVRVATQRLAKRLSTALRDEVLLPGAKIWLQGSSLQLCWDAPETKEEHMTLNSFDAIAQLCCSRCGAEASAPAVAEELAHAFEQECFCLVFRDHVWAPQQASLPSLWAAAVGSEQPLEERLLFLEQVAAFAGHPLHVMAKSRLPLSLAKAADYAPEFKPRVQLRLLAVEESLVRVFPSVDAWQALWADKSTVAKPCFAEALRFLLIPVHPLNEWRMRELYAAEFERGYMLFLSGEGSELPSVPTLSLRTVVPCNGEFHGMRIKLPVPVQATSLMRYVSPVEVCGSALISRALGFLDPELPREIAILREEYAVHLSFGHKASYTYEEARFCSAIFRVSPSAIAAEGCQHAPLATMFATSRVVDDGPSLWEDFWQQNSINDGAAWFRDYAATVIAAQIGVFLRFGLALEAHQQNVFLEFQKGGILRRLICQELGGGVFWDPERLALLPVDFRNEVYERDDVLVPFEKCLACVRHTMLRMHLLPLAGIVARSFGASLDELLQDLDGLLLNARDKTPQSSSDRLPPQDYANYATSTIEQLRPGKHGQLKALLRMRLQRSKEELYVDGKLGGHSEQ